ncbi:hypothetical protein [Brumimicrobium aurantiacum]|uniref:DUF4293 family protein n=1 Tax=Brumimicrobium aurantiacum TaxID=1737063 RepID=A0A3E1F1J7_9FLAO|nr:hypothetical protein [Brumimicrobium aurantiacum]RFC55702.1 hypothetical protein DXU93_01850 [Brumimicrobium aurantiacum]
MTKWATYSFVIALISMLLPTIFNALGFEGSTIIDFLPYFSIVFGSAGVILLFSSMMKNKSINLSGVMLLLSITLIIYGVSLNRLAIEGSSYLLLTGVVVIGVWLIIPNKINNN